MTACNCDSGRDYACPLHHSPVSCHSDAEQVEIFDTPDPMDVDAAFYGDVADDIEERGGVSCAPRLPYSEMSRIERRALAASKRGPSTAPAYDITKAPHPDTLPSWGLATIRKAAEAGDTTSQRYLDYHFSSDHKAVA